MKKLLTSALLTGLLLGTVSPVLAVELAPDDPNGSTPVTSSIVASYTVSIPEALSIDLMNVEQTNNEGIVELVKLTAAGSVSVIAIVEDLSLLGGTGAVNETLDTTINETGIQESTFSLTNTAPTKQIKVETTELNQDNRPGDYTGAINFAFTYNDVETPIEE